MTETQTPPTLDLSKLEGVSLVSGHRDIGSTQQGCAMDAIAWATTGEVNDMPGCVHRILAKKVHALNDAERATEEDRWRIVREGGPLLVGSDQWEAKRACVVIADAGNTIPGFLAALEYAADLRSADLRSADLSSADLSSANLRYADLSYADLSSADLRSANLRYADLRYADLRYADLRYADLRYADLRYARADQFTTWPAGFEAPDSVVAS